jgi:drug/metabolite transporter (DMT)-like permease
VEFHHEISFRDARQSVNRQNLSALFFLCVALFVIGVLVCGGHLLRLFQYRRLYFLITLVDASWSYHHNVWYPTKGPPILAYPKHKRNMTFGLGIAAALGAPFVMTLGFIAWESHWKGSAFALNLFKCNTASILFLILACTVRSNPFPENVFTVKAVGYMFLSSTIGIIIGDWAWLEALRLLGARRVILMDSLKPFLAAFLGWMILDEELRIAAFAGIALTVAGVLLVSLETTKEQEETNNNNLTEESGNSKNDSKDDDNPNTTTRLPSSNKQQSSHSSTETENGQAENTGIDQVVNMVDPSSAPPVRDLKRGYPYAILNVVLDTYGAILIKQHGTALNVWEINLLRFGFAGVLMLVVSLTLSTSQRFVWFTKGTGTDETTVHTTTTTTSWYALPWKEMSWSSWLHVSVSVLLVTFVTPSLSNYALFQIALALALTLGSVGPLYSLPLTYLLQNEVPTFRGVLGAMLAVAGVAVLTWKGTIPE